ncbi:permease [Euzebya tangerina]|uniref:permease n=1 Tax=Euzebya tangerina TaxID=591198 RepID=UPI000E321464|nr:permease [Euzebya tangerina]
MSTPTTSSSETAETNQTRGDRPSGLILLAVAVIVAVLLRPLFDGLLQNPALQTWSTIFVSITIQALPFLALGVIVSGAIAAFVPPAALMRLMPRNPMLGVPVAGVAGLALPGCECGSVPIAGRLASRGASPAAAFAFMLAAPAINPVVLAATAVAFPGRLDIVAARFVASLAAAIIVGWIWAKFGDNSLVRDAKGYDESATPLSMFVQVASHDFVHAGGWLVIGAMAAATLQVAVPRSILDVLAGNEVIAILAMAVLAVVLAICSEADAFVAVGLTQFSLTSRLVFLVVGPAVDVKLIALQAGVFGRRFTARFAPLTFVVAVICAVVVGLIAAALTGDLGWRQGLVVL